MPQKLREHDVAPPSILENLPGGVWTNATLTGVLRSLVERVAQQNARIAELEQNPAPRRKKSA